VCIEILCTLPISPTDTHTVAALCGRE
jgi:hypothetical protein